MDVHLADSVKVQLNEVAVKVARDNVVVVALALVVAVDKSQNVTDMRKKAFCFAHHYTWLLFNSECN